MFSTLYKCIFHKEQCNGKDVTLMPNKQPSAHFSPQWAMVYHAWRMRQQSLLIHFWIGRWGVCDMGNVAIMPNGFSSSFGWAFGVIRLRNRAIIARRFQFCMDSIGRVSRLDDEAVITVYSVMDGREICWAWIIWQ